MLEVYYFTSFSSKVEFSDKTSLIDRKKHAVDSPSKLTSLLFFAVKSIEAKKQIRFLEEYFVLFLIFILPFANSDKQSVRVFIYIT